jgi:hemerythrin superfamily protein
MNAIELLKKDHRTVESLFESFEKAKEKERETSKAELFASIKQELDAHAKVEEEIFYPAFDRAAKKDDDKELVLEAGEEHKQVKTLLAELEGLDPDDATFDAKMKVLKDNIEHHVEEEEGEMFPHAQKELGSDELEQLGQRIAARKEQLQQQADSPAARTASGRPAPSSRARAASPTRRSGRASDPTSAAGVRASDGSGGELLEAMGMDESAASGSSSRTSGRSSRRGSRGASSGSSSRRSSSSSRSSRSRSSSSASRSRGGASRSKSASSGSRSRSSSGSRSSGARRSSGSRRPSGSRSSARVASSRGRSSSKSRGSSSSRSRGARGRGRSARG